MRRDAALVAPPLPEARPGRACPVSYRYSPRVFDRAPQIEAETLYVIGGLYGNPEALEAVFALAGREEGGVRIVFNGDFHWFDVAPEDFARVTRAVLAHAALRGNVETELAAEESGAGCGCAYPADVSDAEVSRSNEILARLRETARREPQLRAALGNLPMHLLARVGDARVAIVHGDASSLAGWGFSRDRLDDPRHRGWIEGAFRDARVDAFACSHTCLAAMRAFAIDGRIHAVANNGAAGMPNFAGTRHGLLTRISTRPFGGMERAYGMRIGAVRIDALRVEYEPERWMERFLASWPEGSPAHASYYSRLVEGPRHAPAAASP